MLQYLGMTSFSDSFGATKSRAWCYTGAQVPSTENRISVEVGSHSRSWTKRVQSVSHYYIFSKSPSA